VDAWNGFKAAADQFHCRFEELREAERSARGVPNDEEYRMVLYRYDVEIDVKKIAERARDALKRVAKRHSRRTARAWRLGFLMATTFRRTIGRRSTRLPSGATLPRPYGGDVGANLAYRAAAKKLAYDLGISLASSPRWSEAG